MTAKKAEQKELLERLRDTGCDRKPFTPEHADCVCRLTNEAADEIERLRKALADAELDADALRGDLMDDRGNP